MKKLSLKDIEKLEKEEKLPKVNKEALKKALKQKEKAQAEQVNK